MTAILLNTFKEFIRNKFLYIFVFLGIFLIAFTYILVQLSLYQERKVFIDISLNVIEFLGLLTTLFLGSYLIYNELQKNTILLILSKNPLRYKFILGKYLGFSLVIFFEFLILTISFLIVYIILSKTVGNFDIYWLLAIFFIYIKILIVLAFLMFFGSFVSPFVSLLATIGIYIIGHSYAFVKYYVVAAKIVSVDSIIYKIISFFYYIFPNFQNLSLKDYLLSPYLSGYDVIHILITIFSSLAYIIILLILAVFVFNKREFN